MDEPSVPLTPADVTLALTDLAAQCEAGKSHWGAAPSPYEKAIEILQRCTGALPEEASEIVVRLLSHAEHLGRPRLSSLAALALMCGEPWASRMADKARIALEASPLARAELDAMLTMPTQRAIIFAHAIADWMGPTSDAELRPRGSYNLSPLVIGMAYCGEALASACARLEAIHRGEIPYKADKAFTVDEGRVLGRIFAVGLDREDGNILSHLRRIWTLAAVAPGAANTMPSQSVTLRLARAVEDQPSPDAAAIMRDVAAAVRHQGVKKKLSRMLGNAERRLMQQPDFLMRLPAGAPLPKTMLAVVRRSLEQLYRRQARLPTVPWQARFMAGEELRALSERLIWRIDRQDGSGFSARPRILDGEFSWHLADGERRSAEAGDSVALWHPLTASVSERDAWRDHVMAETLDQPFMQAFRQHYGPRDEDMDRSRTAMFEGYQIAIRPFLAVAGREGWRIDDLGGLVLHCGGVQFRFWCECNFHPGMTGDTKTSVLDAESTASSGAGSDGVRLRDIDLILFSEVLRSVDLITSAGAFAYDPLASARLIGRNTSPVGEQSALMRREVLRRLYRDPVAGLGPHVGSRHVRIGDQAIHIATGRVTRHGDPIDPEIPKEFKSVAWIPYSDEIMAKIIRVTAWLTAQG